LPVRHLFLPLDGESERERREKKERKQQT